MDPITAGALISGASSLLGGLFSNSSNRSASREQTRFQREFAQYGIRWRVADAQAAGLHPLYALGANTPSYSPVYSSDAVGPAMAAAGQDIGRAVASRSTAFEKAMMDLNLRHKLAEIAETDARTGLLLSERRRNSIDTMNALLPDINDTRDPVQQGMAASALSAPELPTVIKTAPGMAHSVEEGTPLWRKFIAGTNVHGQQVPIVLPGGMKGDAAEVLESLSESPMMLVAVLRENVRRYGRNWGYWFMERYAPLGSEFEEFRRPGRFRSYQQEESYQQRIQKRRDKRFFDEMR